MPQLFVGTSGWAYPSWKPDFYPAKLAQKKFLSHYATQLNTVEVNFTFRQLVKETTIQNWINETPAHFRFGIKAHQVITHIKRLKGTEDFVPRFLATIEPLASAGKLGPVLFQLPPNLKADAELLKDFLALLPRTLPAAFEFRHESWLTDSTWELLKSSGAALCVAETEERTTPDVVTAPPWALWHDPGAQAAYVAAEAVAERLRRDLGPNPPRGQWSRALGTLSTNAT